MTRRVLIALLAGMAAIALLVTGGTLAVGAPTPSHPITFADLKHKLTLTVQSDPLAPDAGSFTLLVDSRYIYRNASPVRLEVAGEDRDSAPAASATTSSALVPRPGNDDPRDKRGQVLHIEYRGAAVRSQPISLLNPPSSRAADQTVQITFDAELHTLKHSAEAELHEGEREFHLQVEDQRGQNHAVQRAAASFEQAVVRSDFSALYDLLNSDVRQAYTRQEFIASGQQQANTLGRVVAMQRLSMGDVQANDDGSVVVKAIYDATLQGAAASHQQYQVVFLQQADGWKVWFSTSA